MKEVKIAELKANLSAHLAAVRKGETVIICDRSTPIARLTSIRQAQDDDVTIEEAIDPPSEARKIKPLNFSRTSMSTVFWQRCGQTGELLR